MSLIRKGLGLLVLAAILLVVGIMGLFVYMGATATPLHPNPGDIPSVEHAAPPAPWTDAVEQGRRIARASLAEQNLPGLSVAVGVGDDVVWAEGFGWANLENRVPVSPATLFRIGTASTVLTSAGVGLLLERDSLNLDETIRTYVPEFPEKPWPVTLGQVMGHVAGIRNDGGDEGPLYSQRCERPADALQHFAEHSLLSEPGTRYRYSSYGWILVSAAVEAVSGEPFAAFMRKEIFEPLRMSDTMPDSATDPTPGLATAYFPKFAADPRYGPDVMREIDYSCYSGASAFVSTPSDLVRFGMAINSGKLLQPATVQMLQAPQRLASGEETGYGLGWDLETVTSAGGPTRVVGHDGTSLGGAVASFMTFPEHGIVVAVISNISYADTFSIASKIAEGFAERRKGRAAPGTAEGLRWSLGLRHRRTGGRAGKETVHVLRELGQALADGGHGRAGLRRDRPLSSDLGQAHAVEDERVRLDRDRRARLHAGVHPDIPADAAGRRPRRAGDADRAAVRRGLDVSSRPVVRVRRQEHADDPGVPRRDPRRGAERPASHAR